MLTGTASVTGGAAEGEESAILPAAGAVNQVMYCQTNWRAQDLGGS